MKKITIDLRLVYEIEGDVMPANPAEVVLGFIEAWAAGIEVARGECRFSLDKAEVLDAKETD